MTFKTGPFADDVEFTGPVMLKLWLRSTTTDMDIFATLRLIDPDGRDVTFTGNTNPRVPLDQGFLRVSHRAVDQSKSTEYQPYHSHLQTEPMASGQLYEVDVEFVDPTSIVVPKGYHLALTIEGKDWQYPPHADTVRSKDYELPNALLAITPVLAIVAKCGLSASLPRGNTSAMLNMRPLRANCGRTGYSYAGRGIGRMRADLSFEGCRPTPCYRLDAHPATRRQTIIPYAINSRPPEAGELERSSALWK